MLFVRVAAHMVRPFNLCFPSCYVPWFSVLCSQEVGKPYRHVNFEDIMCCCILGIPCIAFADAMPNLCPLTTVNWPCMMNIFVVSFLGFLSVCGAAL